MVVMVMAVLLPGATDRGLAAQVVAAAGSEQVTLTLEAKPLVPVIATVYVAEFPAFTVALVGACGVKVKSGVGTNEKFNTLFPPKAMGLGGRPIPTTPKPEVMGPAEPTMM